MKLTKGIIGDISNLDRKPGTWLTARNAVFSEQYGAVFNEYGFELLLSIPGEDCGAIPLDNNLVALFKRDGANSNIYLVDLKAKTRTLVTTNTVYNLSPNHPITGEYYRNSKGQIIIAFTDNFNPPRIINTSINYGVKLDKLTRLYLKSNSAQLNTSYINDSGGSLKSGTYYISTAYESLDKGVTAYSTAIGPFYVVSDNNSSPLDNYIGNIANQATSKSLTLNYQNIDTDYQYFIVVLIAKIDGIMTAVVAKKIPISSTLLSTTIQGSENEGVVSITELLVGVDVYSRVESMTQTNNQLFLANVSKDDEIDYQLAALNITVNYTTVEVDITTTTDSNPKLNPIRGLMQNEVYALYIHWVKDDGSITRGFHIPGRAVAQYGNGLTEFAGKFENNKMNVATGAFIDRAVGIGGANAKIFQFVETADNSHASSNMAYWENTEIYPNNTEYGALQGFPVRHHKMPSISHLKERLYSADNTYGSHMMTRIELLISNVVKPNNCTGYYITAAKRNLNNCTILAQDSMQFGGIREDPGASNAIWWTTCGNWSINSNEVARNIFASALRLRIHAFDLLLNKPNISPTHVEAELLVRNREITFAYNFDAITGCKVFQSGDGVPSFRGRDISNDENCQDLLVVDTTKGNINTTATDPRGRYSACSEFKYLPANVEGIEDYTNLNSEECAVVKIKDNTLFTGADLALHTWDLATGRDVPQFSGSVGDAGVSEELTYIFNLKQYRINMYEDLTSQSLFVLHKDIKIPSSPSDIATIQGGDIIVSDMSFYAYGPSQCQDSNDIRGVRVARRFIVETVAFASFRAASIGAASGDFYPNTPAFGFLMDIVKSGQYNKWKYNADYSSVDDINALTPNDPIANLEFNTLFPERIMRSIVQPVENSGTNNWRTFPINNYYEMPKVRGAITNIQAYANNIVINQLYSVSRTQSRTELPTSTGIVTVGAGDIFSIVPQELLSSKEGYGGCQHKFSCLLTKAGYFFIDAEQGKVFLLGEGLKEISADGNYNFFFSAFSNVADNPLIANGITVGYDPTYNRILLSRNDNSFTISYSIDAENWVSYHDYLPRLMFHNRVGLFSLYNNSIYRHNNELVKAKYYDETIYPTYIIPTFNEPSNIVKYTFVVKWKSEIHKLDGSNQKEETLTHIFMWNSYQATDEVRLINFKNLIFDTYNTRKSAGLWRFNKFRDLVIDNTKLFVNNFLPIQSNIDVNKPIQLKRRFIDHWLNVKFVYDNQPIDGEQRNIYLYEVDVDAKPVER